MKYKVKFLWFSSYKVWEVFARSTEELLEKCDKLCYKYHAMHYEVLN